MKADELAALGPAKLIILQRALICYALDLEKLVEMIETVSEVPLSENRMLIDTKAQKRSTHELAELVASALSHSSSPE